MNTTKRALLCGALAFGLAAGDRAVRPPRSSASRSSSGTPWAACWANASTRSSSASTNRRHKYTVVADNKGNYDEVINGTIAAYRAKRAPHIVQIYERGFMTMLLSGRDRAGAGPDDREEATRSTGPTSSSRSRATTSTRAS